MTRALEVWDGELHPAPRSALCAQLAEVVLDDAAIEALVVDLDDRIE